MVDYRGGDGCLLGPCERPASLDIADDQTKSLDSIVDQRVTAVYFNQNLKVERVALYGLQDGKIFDFISRTTPTGGGDQNFLGQIFKGVTKFNPLGG